MKFKVSLPLPVSGRQIQYTEITNQQFFVLQKYLTTDNLLSISSAFDELITELTGVNSKELFAVDKFCLLIDMRSIFLGNSVELRTANELNIKLPLSDVYSNVSTQLEQSNLFEHIDIDGMVIKLAPPRNFISNDVEDMILNNIYSVKLEDKELFFDDFTQAEQIAFSNTLPADVVRKISAHITRCHDCTSTIKLIKANDAIGLEELSFGLYDNTMIKFLSLIYSNNLMSLYELQYDLISRLQLLTYDHYMRLTPNESRIFINLHNKHIKEQKAKETSQQLPGKGISGA